MALLQLCSVTLESKAWPSGQLLWGQNLDASQLAVLDAFTALHAEVSSYPPLTLCPGDWVSVLTQQGFGIGDEVGGLGEIGRWRKGVVLCLGPP